MALFLCYDIRGIQSFIFCIPKLKYIIGGSALIDQFDRETAKKIAETVEGAEHLYSGGGKGAYYCKTNNDNKSIQKQLLAKAGEIGVDICFSVNENLSEASNFKAQDLYAFEPDQLHGEPCPESALYPLGDKNKHPIIKKRVSDENNSINRYFENRLDVNEIFIPEVDLTQKTKCFFKNVSPSGNMSGFQALGSRNRWAVICMDGNDMGIQFKEMSELGISSEEMAKWVRQMSRALDDCICEATIKGIQAVVRDWGQGRDFNKSEEIILPVRPLIVGGDDIIILCHTGYAMTFVKTVMAAFREKSRELNKKTEIDLWPATSGEVSISAGVLYCPVNLPLHTAIGYAEALLASAKSKGRRQPKAKLKSPSVECIDWEQITDSVIDTPQQRRQRELIFIDKDNNNTKVCLTKRPYTLEAFKNLDTLSKNYEKCPRSVLYQVSKGLRQGFYDRLAFVAELAKHHPALASDLAEKDYQLGKQTSRWKYNDNNTSQETDVLDAILLLEEHTRMKGKSGNDNSN